MLLIPSWEAEGSRTDHPLKKSRIEMIFQEIKTSHEWLTRLAILCVVVAADIRAEVVLRINRAVGVQVMAGEGTRYLVETSLDLQSWKPLEIVTAGNARIVSLNIDYENSQQAFYRARIESQIESSGPTPADGKIYLEEYVFSTTEGMIVDLEVDPVLERAFALISNPSAILVYGLDGNLEERIDIHSRNPTSLSINEHGDTLYVSDLGGNEVIRFRLQNEPGNNDVVVGGETVIRGLGGPINVESVRNSDGEFLLVSESLPSRISIFDSEGNIQHRFDGEDTDRGILRRNGAVSPVIGWGVAVADRNFLRFFGLDGNHWEDREIIGLAGNVEGIQKDPFSNGFFAYRERGVSLLPRFKDKRVHYTTPPLNTRQSLTAAVLAYGLTGRSILYAYQGQGTILRHSLDGAHASPTRKVRSFLEALLNRDLDSLATLAESTLVARIKGFMEDPARYRQAIDKVPSARNLKERWISRGKASVVGEFQLNDQWLPFEVDLERSQDGGAWKITKI